ncbi:MAG: ParB N-terminal domain-containing protein [Candidatus Moranbacteria bacterium]|nr:ParB N-terminal domain-containing protein [Candidatus Moranbacteria bacterium]
MKKIQIISIKKLKPHEKTNRINLKKIKFQLRKEGRLINPIIVDRDNLIILDGHHRVRALAELGYKKIAAYLVDYSSERIKVLPRRPGIKISKEIIIKKAQAGKVFPHKTSKHLIPDRPKNINTPLYSLK